MSCRGRHRLPARRAPLQHGFTLIEVLVAIAIMAMGLSLLYQILGTSTQAVGTTSQYQRASMLVQSLLNAHDAVPASGWNDQGESGGYAWSVRTHPYISAAARQRPDAVPLYQIDIAVQWQDGDKPRAIAVSTLRPERTVEGSANDAAGGGR